MGRTALVIGAAGGMGAEIAKALVANGYRVLATVLNDKEAEHLQAAAPGVAEVHRLDLSDADAVLKNFKGLKLASLDAVIVSAAIGPTGPLELVPLSMLRGVPSRSIRGGGGDLSGLHARFERRPRPAGADQLVLREGGAALPGALHHIQISPSRDWAM